MLSDPADAAAPSGFRLSRRAALAAASAAIAGAALGVRPTLAGAPGAVRRVGSPVRNLIFVVSDGMSNGALALADLYSRHVVGRPSHWSRLSGRREARRAQVSTHSADSLVTDSAAASSAWSVGVKHANGALCRPPDGSRPCPLFIRARQSGRAAGFATTTTITHATPGGFYANVTARAEEQDIARQLLERSVDVALGGGSAYLPSGAPAANPGVSFITDRAALLADTRATPRLVGTFAAKHCPMALDRPDTVPTLAEMTRAALARLQSAPGGFVLQIEGGRVDHAAHANDACSLLHDQLALDEALAVAAEFAFGRADTLLVATTDHATANPGLTFYGKHGLTSMKRLAKARHSFEWVQDRYNAEPARPTPQAKAELLGSLITEATGVALESGHLSILAAHLAGTQVDPFTARNSVVTVMGSILANAFGVAFISPNHSADYVDLFALGQGAETLPPMLDNTDVHTWLVDRLDLPPGTPVPD